MLSSVASGVKHHIMLQVILVFGGDHGLKAEMLIHRDIGVQIGLEADPLFGVFGIIQQKLQEFFSVALPLLVGSGGKDVEIPGVSMTNFMKAAVNARRQAMGKEPLKASDFIKLMKEKRQLVEIDQKLLKRSVNEGFSGGEKKRNEIFQMAMLEPTFCILDETDSGLDVDALRIVATGFNTLRTPETSAMIITHYQRLLDYIKPDVVHVLIDGKIVMTGDADLAEKIENEGFDFIVKSL